MRHGGRVRFGEGGAVLQALAQVLVILYVLACLTIVAAGAVEGWQRFQWHRTLGGGFWASLLGGTVLVFLLLLALALTGALRVGPAR